DRSAVSGTLGEASYLRNSSVAVCADDLGDSSDCENFTVNKAQLTATTKVHDASHSDITNGSVPVGSIVHDTAKLSGVVAGKAPRAEERRVGKEGECGGAPVEATKTGEGE